MLLDIHNFNIRNLAKDVINGLAHQAEKKDLVLLFAIKDNVPSQLNGDSHRLRQVLTNLISNAVKFTHDGSVTLKIELRHQRKVDEVCLRFSVEDTGIGISLENQQKLFRPFVQADGSHTRRYGGTGLGLAIAQGIVELMGGSISIDSKTNTGSIFEFSVNFGIIPIK